MDAKQPHDDDMERRFDNIIGDDVRRGYRLKTVPPELVAAIKDETDPAVVPETQRVRFTKLTPKKRRLANERVVEQYHRDLQAKWPDGTARFLSSEQIKKLNIERGEWSLEHDKRIQNLTGETNRLMKDLSLDGVDKRETWGRDILQKADEVRVLIKAGLNTAGEPVGDPGEHMKMLDTFERWLEFTPEQQDYYNIMFATDQHRPTYHVDVDWSLLTTGIPHLAAVDLLNEIDELKVKLRRYVQCLTLRGELMELQVKQAKMLAESVEQRRDTTDELARLYYCTERVDADDKPLGALTPKFEHLWELPDEVINWLLVEIYFFFQGTPDVEEARKFLEDWGFIVAPPKTTDSASTPVSGDSLAEPNSKPASAPSEATDSGSSA